MFGGLTHPPATELARQLIDLTCDNLQHVFFADSGSVAVEVALKMAIQFQVAQGRMQKTRLLTVRNGYYGDTFGAMSVCDPVTGMHSLFGDTIMQQVFVDAPAGGFHQPCDSRQLARLEQAVLAHKSHLAAVILEPVVQGAGGMRFYSPAYLQYVRQLCDEHDLLLIADEIATGFGRTGKLFACEHAAISPDIMCVGKALTGGYITLAATLTTDRVSSAISEGEPGVFMHGPTFMGNPLACAVANASIDLLLSNDWQGQVKHIEAWLVKGLKKCEHLVSVKEVRVLGAIGVVELLESVNIKIIQPAFVEQGVWVRPFLNLVYIMPPYIISSEALSQVTEAIYDVVKAFETYT